MRDNAQPVWIGTSWKMNKLFADANEFVDGLLADNAVVDQRIQRFVIPPFTLVREVKQRLSETDVKVGAQNMHWQDSGAWTGEVSPLMLLDCGLDIVELGHSERRAFFAESDETVGLKTAAAITHGLIPLICVGETDEQKEAGQANSVLSMQVTAALSAIDEGMRERPLLLAYEPVWAIGDGGTPASASYADAKLSLIADVAESILGYRPRCLYGGSVNTDNCQELIGCANIDGLFIGRSAWQVDGYNEILKRCSQTLDML